MSDLSNALRLELFAIGLTPAAVLAVLGWVLRDKWQQMLARALAVDLEREKASALREIEAYKVSLIADAERHKASVELKKVIAVKHATEEYEALAALYNLLLSTTSIVCTRAALVPTLDMEDEARHDQYKVASEALRELDLAMSRANIFLPLAAGVECMRLGARLTAIIGGHLIRADSEPLAENEQNSVFEMAAQLRVPIKTQVEELVRIAIGDRTD